MTSIVLLDRLRDFSEEVTKDFILPVAPPDEDIEPPPPRAPLVFRARLPEFSDAVEKAPYVLHQLVTRKDVQPAGQLLSAQAVVRTVFCVYSEDAQEGGMQLLNLMERLRIKLLERRVIGKQFRLDMGAGLDSLVYPDDGEHPTAPYFLGEMYSVWKIQSIERMVTHGEKGNAGT